MRGMEACKSEQEGQRREKEDQLYTELEGLKAQLDDFERRNSALHSGFLLLQHSACLIHDSPARRVVPVSKASMFRVSRMNRTSFNVA